MYVDVVRICLWFAQNEITWMLAPLTGAAIGIIVFALSVHYRRRSLPARTLGLVLVVTGCIGASAQGALMQFEGVRDGHNVTQTKATAFGQVYKSQPVVQEISLWATEDAIHIDRWNIRDKDSREVLATALAGSYPIDTIWEHSPGVPVYGASGGVQWRFGESLTGRDTKAVSWTDWDREYHRDSLQWHDPHQEVPNLWWRDSEGWENRYGLRILRVPEPATICLTIIFLAAMMMKRRN